MAKNAKKVNNVFKILKLSEQLFFNRLALTTQKKGGQTKRKLLATLI